MRFRQPGDEPAPYQTTKFDSLIVRKLRDKYKFQTKSGRAQVLALASDGMRYGDLIKLAAEKGFPVAYVLGCVEKHIRSENPMFTLENAPGEPSYADLKAAKVSRKLPEDVIAKREAKEAERAAKREAKEREKAEKAAAKAAEKAKREQEKIAAAQKKLEVKPVAKKGKQKAA